MSLQFPAERHDYAAMLVRGLQHPDGSAFQVKPVDDPIWEQMDPSDEGLTNSMLLERAGSVVITHATDLSKLHFSDLMMGSTELTLLFREILKAGEVTQKAFNDALESMVEGEQINDFDHDQIMDHLRDNFASSYLTWPYFEYAMKALGATKVTIIVE
jgi:hypothetical protein